MAAYKTITREQLKAKLDKGEKFHFWCVLTQEWYKNLLIAGSQWVPLDKMEMHIKEAVVKPTDEIVVYCGSQQCSQSRQGGGRARPKGIF